MKLETTIPPRTNGVVFVTVMDGTRYEFKPEGGRLLAEIADEKHVGWMLSTGHFAPADEEDFVAASALMADDGEADEADEVEDEPDMDALPIEAGTPPVKKRGRPRKAA